MGAGTAKAAQPDSRLGACTAPVPTPTGPASSPLLSLARPPANSVHPSERGALALAELLLAPLQRALLEAAAGLQLKRRGDPRLEPLPPPMIPDSPERSTSYCAMMASRFSCCLLPGAATACRHCCCCFCRGWCWVPPALHAVAAPPASLLALHRPRLAGGLPAAGRGVRGL